MRALWLVAASDLSVCGRMAVSEFSESNQFCRSFYQANKQIKQTKKKKKKYKKRKSLKKTKIIIVIFPRRLKKSKNLEQIYK